MAYNAKRIWYRYAAKIKTYPDCRKIVNSIFTFCFLGDKMELASNYKVKLPNQPAQPPKWEFKTRGVSHSGLAIYIKRYLKAKEEIQKRKYFTTQKYNLQKIL
jgi:hypothetical protein